MGQVCRRVLCKHEVERISRACARWAIQRAIAWGRDCRTSIGCAHSSARTERANQISEIRVSTVVENVKWCGVVLMS